MFKLLKIKMYYIDKKYRGIGIDMYYTQFVFVCFVCFCFCSVYFLTCSYFFKKKETNKTSTTTI